jgi:hypothetical protein
MLKWKVETSGDALNLSYTLQHIKTFAFRRVFAISVLFFALANANELSALPRPLSRVYMFIKNISDSIGTASQ